MTVKKHLGSGADLAAVAADQERENLHRQILSSVSHDLKTPLASIIGSLEVYERMDGRLSHDQQQKLIGVALHEAYRLDNFITNILDMAKLENGMVKLRKEPVMINSLIEECMMRLGHKLKGIEVDIQPSQDSLVITTDSTLLSRVVCLLLDNAVKYGGPAPAIAIVFGREENGDGFITIADTGAGVPHGRLEEIFSKYTRFARGDQQNAGTGLGLAICREIMRLLGGTVVAANAEKCGMVFTVRFPAALSQ